MSRFTISQVVRSITIVVSTGMWSCHSSQHPESAATGGAQSVAGSAGTSSDNAAMAGASETVALDAAVDQAGASSFTPPDDVNCFGDLPVMKVLDKKMGVAADPDWSCYTADAGSSMPGSSTQPLQFKLVSLTMGDLSGITVDFFLGASTLGMPFATRTFDANSDHVMLDVPADLRSITTKVHAVDRDAMTSIAELREYSVPILNFTDPTQGFILLTAQRKLIVNLALQGMMDDDPTKAFLISYARDCSGNDLRGAQFELSDEATSAAVENSAAMGEPHTTYVQFALPNPQCTFTSYDQAAWVMINAPVNATDMGKTQNFRLRVKGRMHESDVEPVWFGEAEVEMVAGAVTFVHLIPHAP